MFRSGQTSSSLPVSPTSGRRDPIANGGVCGRRWYFVSARVADCRTVVTTPCLDNLLLPYADDSLTSTPTSTELCNFRNAVNLLPVGTCRVISVVNDGRRQNNVGSTVDGVPVVFRKSLKDTAGCTSQSPPPPRDVTLSTFNQLLPRPFSSSRTREKRCEPTHFHWNTVKVKPPPDDVTINAFDASVSHLTKVLFQRNFMTTILAN